MSGHRYLLLAAAVLSLAQPAGAQNNFYLKNGDRVVFYGDSITEQRLYTSFVESYVVTRFPKLHATFVHSGVGGDRVTGGWMGPIDPRLDRDAIPYHPTVMTIMLGMNDHGYRPYDESLFNTYATGYRHILDKMKSADPGIRFTLIIPSPYDDVTRKPNWDPGNNSVLLKYGDFVKDLAGQEHQTVADLNGPVVAMLQRANGTDAELAKKLIPDRVHPGAGGHLIMAESLLHAWNAPALVSSVEINGAQKQVAHAEHAHVGKLEADGGGLSWEETEDALPFPLDTSDQTLMLAVHSSDFVDTLDQEPLKVTGLTGDRYTLKIDGATVGTFSRDELSAGINLATLPTPMLAQARTVHGLTWKHLDVHQTRWRNVQFPFLSAMDAAVEHAMAAMDALDADIVRQQHAAAQPVPHKYELLPG